MAGKILIRMPILSSWDRIKARAVDGNPSFMPRAQNSPLSTVNKQKITDWVNADTGRVIDKLEYDISIT